MKITLLLLVVGVCLVSAKYLPYELEDSNGLLLRNKRSDSEESNSSAERVKDSDDSDDDDSLEKKLREREEKRREKEEKLKKKQEEQQEKQKQKDEERRRKEEERKKKLEEKREEEERKEQERKQKEERKRQEKLEKEKRKQEEQQKKEEEKRIKQEKKRQEKMLNDLKKEAHESQDDSFLETEEENSVEMEDIWRSHIYMKYGLTLASTNAEKQQALAKYIQEELGLQPNSTKSERRQAITNLIQNKLQNDTVAIEAIRKQVLSRLNAITLQNLRNDIEKEIEEINNKTNTLKTVTLPWAASAQQTLDEKKSFLQTISQFMATIIPNWFSGNNLQNNVPVSTEANVVNSNQNIGGSSDQVSNPSAVNNDEAQSPMTSGIPSETNDALSGSDQVSNPSAVNNDEAQSPMTSGIPSEANDAISGSVTIKPISSNSDAASDNGVPNSSDQPLAGNNDATSNVNLEPSVEQGNNLGTDNSADQLQGSISNGNNPSNSDIAQPIASEDTNSLANNIQGPSAINSDGLATDNAIVSGTNNEKPSLNNDQTSIGSESIGNSLPSLVENAESVSTGNNEISNGDVNNEISTKIPLFENSEDSGNTPINSVLSTDNSEPSLVVTDGTINDNNVLENNEVTSNVVTKDPETVASEVVNNEKDLDKIPVADVTTTVSVDTSSINGESQDLSNNVTPEIPNGSGVIDLGVSGPVLPDTIPSNILASSVVPIDSATDSNPDSTQETVTLNANEGPEPNSVPLNVTVVDLTSDSNKEQLPTTNLDNLPTANNDPSSDITTQAINLEEVSSEPAGNVQVNTNTTQSGEGQQNNLIQENATDESNTGPGSNTSNMDVTSIPEQSETIPSEAPEIVTDESHTVVDIDVTEKYLLSTLEDQKIHSVTEQDYTGLNESGTTESVVNTPANILEDFTLANEPGATVVEIVTQ